MHPQQPLLFRDSQTRRYLIYKAADSRDFLCVAAATSERHALRVARQNGFTLTETAYAKLEPQTIEPVLA